MKNYIGKIIYSEGTRNARTVHPSISPIDFTMNTQRQLHKPKGRPSLQLLFYYPETFYDKQYIVSLHYI